MKYIITTTFVFLTTLIFSQKSIDTTLLMIPVKVGQTILLDLNELERLKKQEQTYINEITQLENKVSKTEKIVSVLEEKDKKNNEIIKLSEDKYKLVDEENKNLIGDIKKTKTKHIIIDIIGGAIITGLTYVLIFK